MVIDMSKLRNLEVRKLRNCMSIISNKVVSVANNRIIFYNRHAEIGYIDLVEDTISISRGIISDHILRIIDSNPTCILSVSGNDYLHVNKCNPDIIMYNDRLYSSSDLSGIDADVYEVVMAYGNVLEALPEGWEPNSMGSYRKVGV